MYPTLFSSRVCVYILRLDLLNSWNGSYRILREALNWPRTKSTKYIKFFIIISQIIVFSQTEIKLNINKNGDFRKN